VVPREDSRIRLAFPELGEAELEEVRAVLESGALTMGPKVEELEALVAAACGVEHAVAVSNGTAALHLAVLALGLGAGDEVIVPAYTFPATANVVRLAGATPVLVDVDPATFNLDLGRVYDAVTPRTKAVRAEGIEVQIGTYALHRLSAYRDQGPFPGADAAFERALALPLHSRLTDADLDRVAAGVARFA